MKSESLLQASEPIWPQNKKSLPPFDSLSHQLDRIIGSAVRRRNPNLPQTGGKCPRDTVPSGALDDEPIAEKKGRQGD
jgi:hypothetical protein